MADECVDSGTVEQMALCIWFVESIGTSGEEFKDREEFIGFVELEKADAGSVSCNIVEYFFKNVNLIYVTFMVMGTMGLL